MRRYRNPSPKVTNDEIAVLITFSKDVRMADCCFFKIQGMEMTLPADTFNACYPGDRRKLINFRRVDSIYRAMETFPET